MSRLLAFLLVATSPLPSFAEGKSSEDLFYVALMAFGEGVKADAAGDFDKAINSYEKAASLAHSANLHGNLANLYFKVGDHGKAILHYRKALLLAPDNRELKANLARVREIAEIPIPLRSMDDSYFAPSTIGTWCWITATLFWLGLFAGLILMRSLLPTTLRISIATSWLTLIVFGAYAAWRADHNAVMLVREAVAVAPLNTAGEKPSMIALRRYAGDSNEANAELKSGEIVHIDIDQDSTLKEHRTPDSDVWYLARSQSGGKKGWATSKELLKVLD